MQNQDKQTKNTIVVEIHGRKYRIASSDCERIEQVAACLNDKIREVATRPGYGDISHTIVLAALELTAELFQAQRENEQLLHKAHESISRLSRLIDQRGDLLSMTSKWINQHSETTS